MDKFKNSLFYKIINSLAFKIVGLFLVVLLIYFLTNIWTDNFTSVYLGIILLAFLFGFFSYLLLSKKINGENIAIFILLLGIIVRIMYGANNPINSHQHDVLSSYSKGHYGYALSIFVNKKLPDTNASQFYQPPLNAIMQAMWMRLQMHFIKPSNENAKQLFDQYLAGNINLVNTNSSIKANKDLIEYLDTLYKSCSVLSIYYSCITLIAVYYILKQFDIKKETFNVILLLCSIQPVLVMMSGTFNNDNLSFMFFFLALLFAIKWYKNPSFISIIFIGLFIGLGMVTKFSIGLIALIVGPMIIIRWIKSFKEPKEDKFFKKKWVIYALQIIAFAIIVFPLGLSYAIRNYIKFDQSLTYILDFGRDSWLHENIKDRSVFERYFSFPIKQFVSKDYGIFHDYREYNIWIDLLKTSTYEEFSYAKVTYPFAGAMLISNLLLYLSTIVSFVYTIVTLLLKKYKENILLTIISLSIVTIGIVSYISLNIKMPYSCTSNYRYIAYISFAGVSITTLAISNINKKALYNVYTILVMIFGISSCIFVCLL